MSAFDEFRPRAACRAASLAFAMLAEIATWPDVDDRNAGVATVALLVGALDADEATMRAVKNDAVARGLLAPEDAV